MGCFPACLGQLRRNLTTKKIQHQCLSQSNEQHESVKLLPEKVEPQKEEEQIMNPIKLIMAESENKHEETKMDGNDEENPLFFNQSNLKKVADELVENANGEAEKETEEGKDYESGLNRIQESAVKYHGHQELVLLNEKECVHVQEESCSSLFSLSIDSRRQVHGAEMGGEREVSSQMKTRNNTSLKNDDEEKENVALVIEQSFEKSKAIETSLSTWLVESREMSGGSSSPESENNYGDRQILGVISSNADVKKVESISNHLIDSEA